jgi:hypothetical protein
VEFHFRMALSASAADVRSILSLPGPSSTPVQPKKSVAATSARKPEGISRELYSLIGPSAPSLAAQFAKPRLKQKPNFGGGSKTKWCVVYYLDVAGTRFMIFLKGMASFQEWGSGRWTTTQSLGQSLHRSSCWFISFIYVC